MEGIKKPKCGVLDFNVYLYVVGCLIKCFVILTASFLFTGGGEGLVVLWHFIHYSVDTKTIFLYMICKYKL